MRYGFIVFFVVLVMGAYTAYSSKPEPHQFSEEKCPLCHKNDVRQDAKDLKPILSSVCEDCHAEMRQKPSHPVDVYPRTAVPLDMPLVDGKLGCISCHFVHPSSISNRKFSYNLLRRPGKGMTFCITCHGINEKGHIIFENVHRGSYQVTDLGGSLDTYTLQCVECHDSRLYYKPMGSGTWEHLTLPRFKHPVGVPLREIAAKRSHEFNSPGSLPREIRLFDGKIGCGTCHNGYSREKCMLVMNNYRSKLCLACHIK
jgi:hypothetical protein